MEFRCVNRNRCYNIIVIQIITMKRPCLSFNINHQKPSYLEGFKQIGIQKYIGKFKQYI